MKSRKINQRDRNEIVNKLMDNISFEDELEVLKEKMFDIADEIYEHYYGQYLTPEILSALPDSWQAETSRLEYRTPNGKYYNWSDIDMRSPRIGLIDPDSIKYIDVIDQVFIDAINKIEKSRYAIHTRKSEARSKARGALAGIGSTKQLQEIWPEAFLLLPAEDKAALLPVVPTADLNKLFKLGEQS